MTKERDYSTMLRDRDPLHKVSYNDFFYHSINQLHPLFQNRLPEPLPLVRKKTLIPIQNSGLLTRHTQNVTLLLEHIVQAVVLPC
jgi:hypothetical protein